MFLFIPACMSPCATCTSTSTSCTSCTGSLWLHSDNQCYGERNHKFTISGENCPVEIVLYIVYMYISVYQYPVIVLRFRYLIVTVN